MSFRSLSINIQAVDHRPNTERKIDKLPKRPKDKNQSSKIQFFKSKKSYSTNQHPPKSNTQTKIIKSKVTGINNQLFKGKNCENKKQTSIKNAKNLKIQNLSADFDNLAIKKLKVNKATKTKLKGCKIERLKQKIEQLFELTIIDSKRQETKIKYFAEKRCNRERYSISKDDSRKPTPSLYLQSTNFQDPTTFEDPRVQNQKNQNKKFPSLRMLKKFKSNDEGKPQKRKRIESCKFVINPFKNVQLQSQKKFKYLNCFQEQNRIEIEEFRNKMKMNEISEIQKLAKNDDSQIESMNISILGLINW